MTAGGLRAQQTGRKCIRLANAGLAGDADDHFSGHFRDGHHEPGDVRRPFRSQGAGSQRGYCHGKTPLDEKSHGDKRFPISYTESTTTVVN